MRWLRDNLAELHAYGGLALASVGVGLLSIPAGLIVGGAGLFYLAHSIPSRELSAYRAMTGQEKPRAVA